MKKVLKGVFSLVIIIVCIVSIVNYSNKNNLESNNQSLNRVNKNNAILVQPMSLVKEESSKVSVTIGEEVSYYDSLKDAIAVVPDNTETVITLLSDIEINSELKIGANKKVIIDGNYLYTITRGKTVSNTWYSARLFLVEAKGDLTIRNVVIDEGNNWTLDKEAYDKALENMEKITDVKTILTPEADMPIVTTASIYNKGILKVENTTIKNHFTNKSANVFYGYNGSTTTLVGTKVEHCASFDGGVLVYTTGTDTKFYIEEGSVIDDSFAGGNGGVLKIYNNSSVIMNGGEIKNTMSVNTNGVVAMMYGYQSTFTLNGGTISNNSGVNGKSNGRNAAIYLHSGSLFVMNGGTIEYNRGSSCGGVDAVGYSNSNIKLNGGTIQYNKVNDAYVSRSDLNIANDYDLVIGADMVINGNMQVSGDLTNNGIINGKVTLNITDSSDEIALSGNGTLTGDIVINHSVDKMPVIDSNIKVNGDVVPCSTEQVIVTFDYNGERDKDNRTNKLIAVDKDTVPIPPKPIKEGYSVKWYTDKDLTLAWDNSVVSSEMTLYAGWTINTHTVTWDVDGVTTTKEFSYGDVISMIEDPIKLEHKFIGWTNYMDNMTMPDNDVTFTAEFEINKYTINFDSNGGSDIDSITSDYGNSINKPNNPILSGKKFMGWYKDKELTTLYDFNEKIEKDITLYAKWEDIKVVVNNNSKEEVIEEEEVFEYRVLSLNHKFIKNSNINLEFELNGDIDKLKFIKIDSSVLTNNDFNIKDNIISIKYNYLENLSIGTHNIYFVYSNGEVQDSFDIEEEKKVIEDSNTNVEQIEDNSINIMYIIISTIIIVSIVIFGIVRKNKKHIKKS